MHRSKKVVVRFSHVDALIIYDISSALLGPKTATKLILDPQIREI